MINPANITTDEQLRRMLEELDLENYGFAIDILSRRGFDPGNCPAWWIAPRSWLDGTTDPRTPVVVSAKNSVLVVYWYDEVELHFFEYKILRGEVAEEELRQWIEKASRREGLTIRRFDH